MYELFKKLMVAFSVINALLDMINKLIDIHNKSKSTNKKKVYKKRRSRKK